MIRRPVAMVHPAPLTCRHRTPGQVRVDFVQVTTQVELAEASPSDMSPVPEIPEARHQGPDLFLHDGSVWQRENCSLQAFVEDLENPRTSGYGYWSLQHGALLRTPLCANWGDGPRRGLPAGTRKVRTVLADGTDRARKDAADFVARTFRIVGDRLLRRCPGPSALHSGTGLYPRFQVALGHFRYPGPQAMSESQHVASPRADRVAEFWEFERRFYLDVQPDRIRGSALSNPATLDAHRLLPHLDAGGPLDDVLAFAWDAPVAVMRALDPATLADPVVALAAGRVHGWVALGLVGSTGTDEAEAAVLDTCRLVDALAERGLTDSLTVPMDKLRCYGREIALPRLRAGPAPVPVEDAGALSAMAP
jgi:hypothetical protein